MLPKTKIICTLGPVSENPDTLRALAEAGMPAGGQTTVLKLEKVGSVTP